MSQTDETLVYRARRRVTAIVVFALVALFSIALSPALFAIAFVVDLFRQRRFATSRFVALLLVYLAYESLILLASFVVWVEHLFHRDWHRFLVRGWNMQRYWAAVLLGSARWLYGFQVHLEADDDVWRGPMIVLFRHTSVADMLLPLWFFGYLKEIRLRWVIKRELLWEPTINIVGQRIPNYFVRRGSTDAIREVEAIANLLDGVRDDEGVIIYPEGTRYTPAKFARAMEKLKATAPEFVHEAASRLRFVMPPRFAGVLALFKRNRNIGADIVIGMHHGFEKIRGGKDVLNGSMIGATIRVHFRRFAFADVPPDEEGQMRWLMARWIEMDEWVGEKEAPLAAPA
ncbi:1-acyl-sn-glycerol-3-phosphate acyltransferase [bacterium]|nr:1-acyl-sn-glycerol-3-phosphate acyltransferase [bacterium]